MTAAPNGNAVLPPPAGARGPARLLKASRGALQPDVWVIEGGGTRQVWKTWGRRPTLERKSLCAWLACREGRILRRLDGIDGVPRFLDHPQPWTLVMTMLEAEPVPEVKRGGILTPAYFDKLWTMISAMHERGIIHGDLRRKNLLRAPDDPDTPRIVDFTQCLHFRQPVTGLRRIILREAIRIDRVTFLKLKRWYLPLDAMTAGEIEEMRDIPWHLTLGQMLRKRLYRPFKHWRHGRRRR